ncbi:Mercuric transport protein, MerT [hydrothermal vent metagenome]|uniref:Mercuric transport protein, MerT n=1 Tax=hydrothermal vent metagenome TaxID=652676 RepID=A0A3B0RH09_9ZZZZ
MEMARNGDSSKRWFASLGVVGGLLASSCCVAPLAFVLLGISGAWIGNLTALEPYKWYFVGLSSLFLILGFWYVYFRAAPACEDGSYCASPKSSIIIKTALWIGALLVALSATIDWWASRFY